MVEGGGFEPPKAEPTDLQSVPFDRLGIPPQTSRALFAIEPRLSTAYERSFSTLMHAPGRQRQAAARATDSAPREAPAIDGAGDRVRTDDLLFTKQLLCQLSYAGLGRKARIRRPRRASFCRVQHRLASPWAANPAHEWPGLRARGEGAAPRPWPDAWPAPRHPRRSATDGPGPARQRRYPAG